MNKMISILMSVFNDQENIDNAVTSILKQTYENFEFLIIDDFSSDYTYEKLISHQKKDDRIKIFRNEKNLGLTKSLNFLLYKSRGEFIARQDSDDISFVDRLSKQYELVKKQNLAGCTTRAIIKNSSRITPNRSLYLPKKIVMKIKNPFVHGSLFLRKDEFLNVGGYDENFYYAQDYKLMSDLIMNNKKISILKEPLYVLNLENNISTNFSLEQKYYAQCVKRRKNPVVNNLKI